MARCSIRGAEGYNIAEILDENSQYFTGGFGGHALAGGFSFDLGQFSFEEIKTALLETFESKEDAIQRESDIFSDTILIETAVNRLRVSDTDIGRELQESIGYLELLLQAYQDGTIVEKVK